MTNAKVLLNAAITTTAVAYTAGDSIGGLIAQSPGQRVNSGMIQDVNVLDTANQGAAFYIILFSDNPSASTITDNAAFDLNSADYGKVTGVIAIAAADYVTIDTMKWATVATQVNLNWLVPGTPSDSVTVMKPTIWMAVVAAGTPTYGANATSLYITLGLGDTTPV